MFNDLSNDFISDRMCVRDVTDPIKSAKKFTYYIFFMISALCSAVHLHLTQRSRRKAVVLSQTHWADYIILEGNFFK